MVRRVHLSTNGDGIPRVQAGTNNGFHAAPGYDMITGIGVPNINTLIATLDEHNDFQFRTGHERE
jgi:hypothetical protein